MQRNWKDLQSSRFTASILIKSPTEWSLIHAFIECMKENKKLRKNVVLKALKDEVTENEAWYSDVVVKGDIQDMVKQYAETGRCDDKVSFLVASALVNIYNITMMILKQDASGIFFFDKESDFISPKRTKESNAKIVLTVKGGWFRPLANVQG